MTIIGGADGPTSLFLAPSASWINGFGLAVVLLLLVPNIVWAIRNREKQAARQSRLLSVLEQIGRYGCMFLMAFNIGIAEFGFASAASFLFYAVGNLLLLLLYYAFWIQWAKKPGPFPALMLAVLPTLIFLLCGVTLRHWLLVGFALLFGAAHIILTVRNTKEA